VVGEMSEIVYEIEPAQVWFDVVCVAPGRPIKKFGTYLTEQGAIRVADKLARDRPDCRIYVERVP